MKIFVVGAGLGEQQYLTAYARDCIKNADVVLTTKRIYEKLHTLNPNTLSLEIGAFAPFLLEHTEYERAVVLASGDIGFYSIAKTLKEKLKGHELEFISGISSLQYLTAKLQIPYDDLHIISVHGRENTVIPSVCYHKKTFALTGGKYKADDVIKALDAVGLGDVLVTVGENLSDENERIITGKAKALLGYTFDNLAVMLIENEAFVKPQSQIKDSEFIRGKSPMTKEAVRLLSIAKLDVSPEEAVCDIGAGTGSVAIELARKAYGNTVFALEKDAEACGLIGENIKKFGAYNVRVLHTLAPNGMEELPKIDKAFIGGSSGNLAQIVLALREKNPLVKIVVNAITLETLQEATACFTAENFDTEIICVNIARSEQVGKYHMMKGENPIYIITAQGK